MRDMLLVSLEKLHRGYPYVSSWILYMAKEFDTVQNQNSALR